MDKPIAKDISETTCKRCGEDYSLDYGCDPIPYCHQCAHELVEELEAEREELIERTSAAEARVKELEAQVERLTRPVTDEELLKLNEKFGYFEFRDAQGGKSREFVNDLMSTIAARDAEKEKPPQS